MKNVTLLFICVADMEWIRVNLQNLYWPNMSDLT